MKGFKRFALMFALVVWTIDVIFAVILCFIGKPVSPVLTLIPTLFCCYHYAEINWFIYHEEGGNK